jgi:saccharopine dehydrogenase (NAD+, L-lysine-forming)
MAGERWMIYGANGYTGALTAQRAVEHEERPIVAGRRADAVAAVAHRFGLEHRTFALDDPRAIEVGLRDIGAVAHMAGPFSATSAPMVETCLRTRTHYLDITGEIAVFEAVLARDADARAAGVVLLPGAGFDVVPTDCLAAMLHRALPDATHLELAIAPGGGAGAGTLKTMIEGLATGGAERADGRIVRVPMFARRRRIPFPRAEWEAVSIPWGDVSTAFHTTGIPNIVTYMALPHPLVRLTGAVRVLGPLAGTGPMQAALKAAVGLMVKGPDPATRARARGDVWGEVRNAAGRRVSATMTTPSGHELTASATIEVVRRVLAGKVAAGAWTPARAFGPELAAGLPGVEVTAPIGA